VALAVILAVVGFVALTSRGSRRAEEPQARTDASASPIPSPGNARPHLETGDAQTAKRLIGRWLRPDGGYTMEIRTVGPEGKLDAGYFNPRPVNVSKAEYSVSDGRLFVFVELRDTNYPGATYKLSYDPAKDQLSGLYRQPLNEQTYEIFFVRQQD